MIVLPLIERKRDGGRLAPDEWRALAEAYAAGAVPDYQMAALLMAIYFRGLDREEIGALTDAMLRSGAALDLSHLRVGRVDKHSTGGVGDKVSLVLAPIVAALGVAVPMMSGRGLGHTGGTLDKLESIPGFRTDLSLADAARQVEALGCALIGQTGEIAPADRRMYALRDVTGTVEAIPLIAASIMSKKLAEGLTGLVLDVKRGSGAFLPELDRGLELARTMIALGADHGCPTVALITAMDRPLGRACGNALEVEESVLALRGEGPDDLMTVTYALGAEMLLLGGACDTREAAHAAMRAVVADGRAAAKLAEIVEAQGGNPGVVEDPAVLPQAPVTRVWRAPRAGVVARIEPRAVGRGIIDLGGGRRTVADAVDPAVGFVITARPGDRVAAGAPLATIHARDEAGVEAGRAALEAAVRIADEAPPPLPLVSHRVTASGVEVLSPDPA
ncbi:thymidine phosphorylase [Roseisolibacter sp. H3M3-2]|uniref:thymidine phosphorylase n=1 Tax=Roseisolibacter sp. H3M3-2 TaxID=3031323 RepID=UPI0023DA8236|nr:thymidine phosphorylase [Roseisolibacter sp. H3M3-2]MDF1504188.1 thymidine phosphorylase [Roseisolibacter sp. H3M3-2]